MTTCFVRIIVVFRLLRQALGTQNCRPARSLPPCPVHYLLMMTPVWKQVYREAIAPYTQKITLDQAWERGVKPVRRS